jgi:uncharacterized OsmC-like protein
MRFKMPATFPITVEADCPSHARTDARARQHTIVIDEPPQRGGTDVAATPLETLLAAFLGCTNVIFNMIAERRGVRIGRLKLKVTADFDTRGVFEHPVERPFPRIRLEAEVEADASEATIDDLRKELAQRCPVSVILRRAGSIVDERWTVRPIDAG